MLAEMQKREVVESALSVAKMANESKTVFLNSISHDIRTPMNGIIGMTAIAAAHVEDTQKVKYCLGKIKTASNHLLALISDVLDIARIESGRVDDELGTCESTCLTLGELGMHSDYALSGAEGIEKVRAAHEADNDYNVCLIHWKMPNMDGIETTRRTRELVGGEVPIIIISAYDWEDIELEAREAGADAFIAKPLFRSRLDSTIHGLVCPVSENEKIKIMENDPEAYDYSDKRLLLVEDNELNTEIALAVLEKTKVQVETAENGKEAVEKLAGHPSGYYDLVFMDIRMPVMDGLEATRLIRELPKGKGINVPIVAMSANAFAEDVETAFAAGLDDYLSKPINLEKLYGIMKKYFK